MLFNSFNFALFFPIVFLIYWMLNRKAIVFQNSFLLFASYFFYGCWDVRFLGLLLFSTLLDYFTGLKMSEAKNQRTKKVWFWLSISINLGFLGFFKYCNFFLSSFQDFLHLFGVNASTSSLSIILPVGISFYTFHGLSYVIDIYKDRIKPEKNIIDYSLFVSYFPLLVAGPIERATHLLPQLKQRRVFDYSKAVDGLRQILWGLFKKVVIADQCAELANMIFTNSSDYSGLTLVFGAVFFAFQIYCDFSGYSDIALGASRLLGIELLRNFSYPYFSRNIAEFWRRWHISLSTWFRDYLYIPLGGSKGGTWMKIRNTFIIFLVSGFWHGANWTFVAWGFLNALFIMPSILFNSNRMYLEVVAENRKLPTFRELIAMLSTFSLAVFAWIFFRAESIGHAVSYITGIFSGPFFSFSTFEKKNEAIAVFVLILLFILVEWTGRRKQFALSDLRLNRLVRWIFYFILLLMIYFLRIVSEEVEFIYFQF